MIDNFKVNYLNDLQDIVIAFIKVFFLIESNFINFH
jgi:hypothetical protein